ncbi:hypothetical protein [Blastococcus sp. SYSU D01042]
MTSGGHARSGPAPDPLALHRGDQAGQGWLRLTTPTDPPPPWPLGDEPSDQEAAIWNDLWRRPQATAWPVFNLTREVGAYARALALFETKPHAAMGTLIRRMGDDLGLTLAGAARNRWLLPRAGEAATPSARPRAGTVRPSGHRSARERWADRGIYIAPPPSSQDESHD